MDAEEPCSALASYAAAGNSWLQEDPPSLKASVFVKTSPDMSARQAIQAEKRQVVLKADRINFDLALDP
jgi:hypothetical protein